MKTNVFVSAVLAVALCAFPKLCIGGAARGINICLSVVIPSLFPFFVVSKMFIMSGGAAFFGKKLGGFMHIFGLDKNCAAPFVLGLISGYPVGAKSACDLYKERIISKTDAQRLLAFCNNCGPCFLIGTIGSQMLGSVKMGYVLYVIHILSAVSVGILFKSAFKSKDNKRVCKKEIKRQTINKNTFTYAVEESVKTILNVCGYIVFFSVVITLTGRICENALISGFFEMTTAVNDLCAFGKCDVKTKILIISYLCGWAGLCVNMQTKKFIDECGLSFKKYLFAKFCHSVFGFVYAFLYVTFFPAYVPAFVSNNYDKNFFGLTNIMACICIVIFLLYLLKIQVKNLDKKAVCNKTVK